MLIEFRGIPAHARSITTARIILGTSCSDIVEAPPELVGDDCKRFFVGAWCIHPDLVPQVKMMFINEPPEPYVESGLFLRPHEIIHSKHDGVVRLQIYRYCRCKKLSLIAALKTSSEKFVGWVLTSCLSLQ